MKFILPKKRLAKTLFLTLIAALLFTTTLEAQKSKKAPAKTSVKTAPKANTKKTAAAKNTRDSDKKTAAKKTATAKNSKAVTSRSSRTAVAKTTKNTKSTSKNSSKDRKDQAKNSRDKDPKKLSAKERRAELARKKAEEARRQAAIAEQRRREEAARIARERKLAFERGLKNETAENILKDDLTGEDLEIRKAAVDALGSRAGTVVVMEAKTGKIISMVNQDWAIKNSFKPCSTIKLVTGVGGLNEHVINSAGGIGDSTSGMALETAIARSNNGYFQRVGVNFGTDKMISYARGLGLGERTGINADGETPGRLPYGNKNPRIYSHGDDFEVTPLQLAVMVSAIANNGKRVVPQIVKQRQERTFRPRFRDPVNVPYETVQGMLPGMIGTAEWGTANRGVDHSQGIAGKTGSCIFKGSWIGLFTSVAPVEDPQYSVVVITRGEGERGKYAAAVAGQVYRALAPRMRRDRDKYLAIKSIRPAPADAGDADEDEDDDSAAVSVPETSRPVIVVGANNRVTDEPKKTVKRTTQSKPVFPPVVIQYDKEKAEKGRPRIVKN